MNYQRPSFSVPVSDSKPRPDCAHGWVNQLGRCQWCGKSIPKGEKVEKKEEKE